MSCLLSLDPGLGGTGWALWNDNGDLADVGTVTCKQRIHWSERAMAISVAVGRIVEKEDVGHVAAEYPAFMTSLKGDMVARRGDLVKLAFLTGCLAGKVHPITLVPIPVNTWKGQLGKDIVIRRIKRKIPEELKGLSPTSHMWDAIGVGLFCQGRF